MTAVTTQAAPVKPFSITLVGPAVPIFQELGVHIRNGYTVNKDYPIEFFPNGNVSLMAILGNPDEHAVNQAKQSTDESVAREQAEYDRRVREEAKRLVEMEQREQLERNVAAEIAEHKRKIAAIEKQAAAALAKLDSQ